MYFANGPGASMVGELAPSDQGYSLPTEYWVGGFAILAGGGALIGAAISETTKGTIIGAVVAPASLVVMAVAKTLLEKKSPPPPAGPPTASPTSPDWQWPDGWFGAGGRGA